MFELIVCDCTRESASPPAGEPWLVVTAIGTVVHEIIVAVSVSWEHRASSGVGLCSAWVRLGHTPPQVPSALFSLLVAGRLQRLGSVVRFENYSRVSKVWLLVYISSQ